MSQFLNKPWSMSDNGLKFTATSEGFRATIGNDVGHPVIGYGHDIKPGEHFPDEITQDEGLVILRADLAHATLWVNKLVTVPLTQGMADALIDFTFNEGEGALMESTLLKQLNNKEYDAACKSLEWEDATGQHGWVYIHDPQTHKPVLVSGLVGRRKGEQQLWNS